MDGGGAYGPLQSAGVHTQRALSPLSLAPLCTAQRSCTARCRPTPSLFVPLPADIFHYPSPCPSLPSLLPVQPSALCACATPPSLPAPPAFPVSVHLPFLLPTRWNKPHSSVRRTFGRPNVRRTELCAETHVRFMAASSSLPPPLPFVPLLLRLPVPCLSCISPRGFCNGRGFPSLGRKGRDRRRSGANCWGLAPNRRRLTAGQPMTRLREFCDELAVLERPLLRSVDFSFEPFGSTSTDWCHFWRAKKWNTIRCICCLHQRRCWVLHPSPCHPLSLFSYDCPCRFICFPASTLCFPLPARSSGNCTLGSDRGRAGSTEGRHDGGIEAAKGDEFKSNDHCPSDLTDLQTNPIHFNTKKQDPESVFRLVRRRGVGHLFILHRFVLRLLPAHRVLLTFAGPRLGATGDALF